MIGTQVERQGIIRAGAKMISAVSEATVPKISVIVRKAYGAGLYAMAGPAFEPDACIALPSAKIAVMGPQAAINAVFYNQLQAIEDPAEREAHRGAAARVQGGDRHPPPGLGAGGRRRRAARGPARRAGTALRALRRPHATGPRSTTRSRRSRELRTGPSPTESTCSTAVASRSSSLRRRRSQPPIPSANGCSAPASTTHTSKCSSSSSAQPSTVATAPARGPASAASASSMSTSAGGHQNQEHGGHELDGRERLALDPGDPQDTAGEDREHRGQHRQPRIAQHPLGTVERPAGFRRVVAGHEGSASPACPRPRATPRSATRACPSAAGPAGGCPPRRGTPTPRRRPRAQPPAPGSRRRPRCPRSPPRRVSRGPGRTSAGRRSAAARRPAPANPGARAGARPPGARRPCRPRPRCVPSARRSRPSAPFGCAG